MEQQEKTLSMPKKAKEVYDHKTDFFKLHFGFEQPRAHPQSDYALRSKYDPAGDAGAKINGNIVY